MGDNTLYNVDTIDGLDSLPDISIGMAPKPRRHGSWLGGKLAQKRVITMSFDIMGDPADDYRTTKPKNALVQAMRLQDEEQPLVFEMDYGEQGVLVYASVTALDLPLTSGYSRQRRGTVEFTCTNPMKYSVNPRQGVAAPPSPPTGAAYGLTYGFAYSQDTGITGSFTAHNGGNSPAAAVYTITGPVSRPKVTLLDGQGSRATTFATNLAEKDVLLVDTVNNRVTINGSDAYSTVSGALVADLVIRPGDTTVSFDGDVPSGKSPRLNVSWRDASR